MALHQRNRLHSTSWIDSRSQLKGDTQTNAILVDFSYGIEILPTLDVDVGGGLGYRKTTSSADWVIAGVPDSVNKVDQGFVWSAGVGLDWNFSEQASLLLAYRYFAEETVPTHNADLGLEFDF
jgi:opacity protein-like surface antigen